MSDETLSSVLQENLLTLLCFDDKHAIIIRGLVEADLFEGYYQEVARTVYTFIDSQKEAPKEHLPDLFDRIIEGKDRKATTFKNILHQLHQTKDGINTDFVMCRLAEFVRIQQLKGAMVQAIDIFQSGKVGEDEMSRIESIFSQAMKRRLEVFDPGVMLGDKQRALDFLNKDEGEVFRTGVKELDRCMLGPLRKGLHLFIGLPKKGKTWWCVNLGKNAFLEGKRVCHITLEMSEEKMARRYYQALFAMCRRRPTSELEALYQTRFDLDELGRLIGFEREELKPKLSLDDPEVRRKLEQKIDHLGLRLNRIIIKGFPTSQLTVPALEAYLDGLELQRGFTPDLLIVDYPMLMKYNHQYQRLMIGQIIKELRGIGVERNLAVAIVSQSSKRGAESSKVMDKHIAEDWSQIATADVVLTYSQTEAEKRLGLARLFVADARDEEDQFTVLISQSYSTGQFCRASMRMTQAYWSVLDRYGGATVGEGEVGGGEDAGEE